MAVTTSTRNWVRALGSAVGVAVSTAVQFAVTQSSLPRDLPSSLKAAVANGTWSAGDDPKWDGAILDAKMKGIHSAFITFVPLIGMCLVGCVWIKDKALLRDNEKEKAGQDKTMLSSLLFFGREKRLHRV
jgi:hypothetical protein